MRSDAEGSMIEHDAVGRDDDLHLASGRRHTLEVPVHGMTCDGCAAAVRVGLSGLDGVTDIDVDLAGGRAVLTGDPSRLDADAARARVEALGYALELRAEVGAEESPGPSPRTVLIGLAVVLAVVGAGTLLFQQVFDRYLAAGSIQGLNATFAQISVASVGLALLFGVIVAFAPSSYAMAPAVMGYVTGSEAASTRTAARLSSAFVAGVIAVDMLVGAAFAAVGGAAMRFFTARLPLWYAIITVVLVALALVNLRVWRPRLPSFVPTLPARGGAGGAFLIGLPFGLMSCPSCTPLLLPVALGAAATGEPLYGAALMGAFGLGRGVPLAVLGTFTGAFRSGRAATRWVPWLEKAVGVLLLLGAAWFVWQFFLAGGPSEIL